MASTTEYVQASVRVPRAEHERWMEEWAATFAGHKLSRNAWLLERVRTGRVLADSEVVGAAV